MDTEIKISAQTTDAIAGTQGIRRLLGMLKTLGHHQQQGLRFVDIAQQCNLQQPTAHRMLKALLAEEMVARDPHSRRYRLGPLAFELGVAAAPQFKLTDICAPSLRRLAQTTGDTSFLFIRRGDDSVCISREQGNYPIQTPMVTVGSHQPLGLNAGGLALLLALAPEQVELIVNTISPRLAAYDNCDAGDIRRAVERGRMIGYASIGERAVPGVTAIGLAVRTKFGSPSAALAVAATTNRMTPTRQAELLPILRNEVKVLAELLYKA